MPPVVRVALFALLLALSQAQATDASVSIFRRLAVLTYDSPVTQQLDEAASVSVPHADPASDALARVQAAAAIASGRARSLAGTATRAAVRASWIARAPPAV